MVVPQTALLTNEIAAYLAPNIRKLLLGVDARLLGNLEEIRLRCHRPLVLRVGDKDYSVDQYGRVLTDLRQGYVVSREDLYRSIASISDNSLYAFEEEIRRGFITIPGGHRVGLAGQVVVAGQEVRTMKNFSGLCFRVAREVPDCALGLLNQVAPRGIPVNTLIVSPPRCGKTTMLRDLARLLSDGTRSVPAHNVVVVDERSEIAGCFQGIPQLNVGVRTDVLDACPKAVGMMMAIRSLSPQIIITDEVGRSEDIEAINECLHAGIAIMTSIHARNIEELRARPLIRNLLDQGAFRRGIILSRQPRPGRIEEVIRWDE
jgi:stage III sporulation protein AA